MDYFAGWIITGDVEHNDKIVIPPLAVRFPPLPVANHYRSDRATYALDLHKKSFRSRPQRKVVTFKRFAAVENFKTSKFGSQGLIVFHHPLLCCPPCLQSSSGALFCNFSSTGSNVVQIIN